MEIRLKTYQVAALFFAAMNYGCAVLHHVQIGEIDNRSGSQQRPFDIKVSEVGINIEEAGKIVDSLSRNKDSSQGSDIASVIGLFQMGPHTGNGVFDLKYARKLIYAIHEKCPSGRVTGLTSVREMRKYPVISGEIVKITGYCLYAQKDR